MHHYEVSSLEGMTADQQRLSSIDAGSSDPIPVVYQSGYLTIKDYDAEADVFTLGFHRKIFKIGANFSTAERRLTDYIVV